MYRDIILARSRDGGRSFSQTVVSHDRWEINGCPVAGPSFSIDRAGHVTVVWFMGGDEPGLYYATSTDDGRSFSARQLLDSKQHDGRHAQTTQLTDGRVLVAWDYGTDKVSTTWAVIDAKGKGLLGRSSAHEGVNYPTVASNGQRVVITGMKSSTREMVMYVDQPGMGLDAAKAQAQAGRPK
jgi:hypothetical protein